MRGGRDGFFRSDRWLSGGDITERVFDLAYFWRVPPATILALSLEEFELYEAQALRIADSMNPDSGG